MKLLRYWKETWGSLVIILIPLIYSIDFTKTYVNRYNYSWILVIAIFIWAWVQTNLKFISKKEQSEIIAALENENAMIKFNLESIPENMVKNFYKHFKLGNDDRVTVYRVQENQWFVPVGRFSDNPLYKKSGRSEYPIDSGFIGQCWEKEEVKVEKLPNYNKGHDRYIQEVTRRSSIEADILKGLSMKSRSFYCKRLTFNGDEPLAVVVVESCKSSISVDFEELKGFLEGPFGKSLVEAIKNNLPIGKGE